MRLQKSDMVSPPPKLEAPFKHACEGGSLGRMQRPSLPRDGSVRADGNYLYFDCSSFTLIANTIIWELSVFCDL